VRVLLNFITLFSTDTMRLRISLLLTVLDAACILAAPEVHIGKTLVTGSLSTLKDNVEVFKG
jgi:hypothetical protein